MQKIRNWGGERVGRRGGSFSRRRRALESPDGQWGSPAPGSRFSTRAQYRRMKSEKSSETTTAHIPARDCPIVFFTQFYEVRKNTAMTTFLSARTAKDFLVSLIVQEARHQNVPLSEVERKMLYFTETYESLPDIMDVADKFDAEYDQDEYEAKIARLIKSAYRRLRKESPGDLETWKDAVKYLRKEDHYILVMIDLSQARAGGENGFEAHGQSVGTSTGWRDQLKLLAAGLVVAVAFVGVAFLSQFVDLTRIGSSKWLPSISDDTRGKLLVGGIILLAVIGGLHDYLFPKLWRKKLKLK
jgi:hypothetical protein